MAIVGRDYDAFGRLPVSNPQTLGNYQSQYDGHPLFWETATLGTGSSSHDADTSTIDLTIAAADDQVIRQTRGYHRYQPGKSQLVFCTFNCLNDGDWYIVRRSNITGSVVDTAVAQTDWNQNQFDKSLSNKGFSKSYDQLDKDKSHIFWIDFEWLGVGIVRTGFVVDGQFIQAHVFNQGNAYGATYMTTANLPVRYEITNTGGTTYKRVGYFDGENGVFLEHRSSSTSTSLRSICASVMSEGGFDTARGIPFCASNGITQIAVTTRRAILSIRPKATFNSITNRSEIIVRGANAFADTNVAYVEVVYNATLGGTPSWTSTDDNSVIEYDVAGTTVTGGQVINAFYVPASSQGSQSTPGSETLGLLSRLPLTLDIAGANPINLSLVATSFSGTSNVSGALYWQEIR